MTCASSCDILALETKSPVRSKPSCFLGLLGVWVTMTSLLISPSESSSRSVSLSKPEAPAEKRLWRTGGMSRSSSKLNSSSSLRSVEVAAPEAAEAPVSLRASVFAPGRSV